MKGVKTRRKGRFTNNETTGAYLRVLEALRWAYTGKLNTQWVLELMSGLDFDEAEPTMH